MSDYGHVSGRNFIRFGEKCADVGDYLEFPNTPVWAVYASVLVPFYSVCALHASIICACVEVSAPLYNGIAGL